MYSTDSIVGPTPFTATSNAAPTWISTPSASTDVALFEDPLELGQSNGGIHVAAALGQADAGIDDGRVLAVDRLEIAGLGRDRRRDGREIGNQLGILTLDRFDDHGAGAADDGA